MAQFVKLQASGLTALREMDERLVSYNVEMTEVTGGTFWKAYSDAQVDGTEEFPVISDWTNMGNLQQWYDPIDTKNPRLIKLAKDLGTAWVRVSGTWANKTYYDFDGHCNGQVPEGFQNLLTKDQWLSLLDFVKAIDGKLLVSIANCPGIHAADEPMPFDQAELLFRTSKEYGVPISAAEFTNEPNLIALSGLPHGYTAADHARDHDLFGAWLKENYPECLFVGPCTVGDGGELTQLVQGTGNIRIGGAPGVAAAAGIAGFGDPHLAAGNILITAGNILAGAVGGNAQILFRQDRFVGPMAAHSSTTLGNTIIIMIAEHIAGVLVIAQQLLGRYNIKA